MIEGNDYVNQKPNVQYVDNSMETIRNKVTSNDFFIFIYCGHITGTFSYCQDHTIDKEKSLQVTECPYDLFKNEFINQLHPARSLMLWDCCYAAGNIAEYMGKTRIIISASDHERTEARVDTKGFIFSSGFSKDDGSADGFIDGLISGESLINPFKVGSECWVKYEDLPEAEWKTDPGPRRPLLEDNEKDIHYDNDGVLMDEEYKFYGHWDDYPWFGIQGYDGGLAKHTYL